MMRKYESIIIFDPKLSDARVKEACDKVTKFVEDNGGSDLVTDTWGKRELPYPMKKCSIGNYFVFYFESDNADLVNELQAQLRITEGVLKFQSHRIHDRVRKFRGSTSENTESTEEQDAA